MDFSSSNCRKQLNCRRLHILLSNLCLLVKMNSPTVLLPLFLLKFGIVQSAKTYTDGDTSDIFSSTFQMHSLLKAEIDFIKKLKMYLNSLETQVETIKDFLSTQYNDDTKNLENLDNFEEYVSHPFNAFGVVSRTNEAKDLPLESNLHKK